MLKRQTRSFEPVRNARYGYPLEALSEGRIVTPPGREGALRGAVALSALRGTVDLAGRTKSWNAGGDRLWVPSLALERHAGEPERGHRLVTKLAGSLVTGRDSGARRLRVLPVQRWFFETGNYEPELGTCYWDPC